MKQLLAKRKTSSAQAETLALATPSTVARTKSLGTLQGEDISVTLRKVLKIDASDNSDDADESEEESDALVAVASPSPRSGRKLLTSALGLAKSQESALLQPVTAATTASILRSSARAIEVTSSSDELASSPEVEPVIEKPSCPACADAYHSRNKLGLTFQWLKQLSPDQIELCGKNLTPTQRERLLEFLKATPDAITCNLETLAEDDEERVIVDLAKLPPFLLEDLVKSTLPASPVTQIVPEEVVVVKEVEVIKEIDAPLTLAQRNAGYLEKCAPAGIRLLQNGDIQNATLAQKTIAKAWILQSINAVSLNLDGSVSIELAHLSKDTKVPHKLKKSTGTGNVSKTHKQSTHITQVAIPALKVASLIGIGYMLAQLLHK